MDKPLLEGVTYDKENEAFSFDFTADDERSVVKLVSDGPYRLREFDPCTYFGYVFEDDVDSRVKKDFIDLIKYPNQRIRQDDLRKFVFNAVVSLDRKVSLPRYDVIVHPQSSSSLNDEIISEIYKRSLSDKFTTYELVKELPEKMEFNFDAYAKELRKKPGVNENNVRQSVSAIEDMMFHLKKLDYVKIGTYVKAKWRPYLKNFFMFKTPEAKKAYEALSGRNVLVVDDVSTTRATLQYVLNTIRFVNDACKICCFCLLGNKAKTNMSN